MKSFYFKTAKILGLVIILSQCLCAQPKRPTKSLNLPEVDKYVTSCFDLSDNAASICSKINLLDQQFAEQIKLSGVNDLRAQIDDYTNNLGNLKLACASLIESAVAIVSNTKESVRGNVLLKGMALLQIASATKAVKLSIDNISKMVHVVIPALKAKLSPQPKDSTALSDISEPK